MLVEVEELLNRRELDRKFRAVDCTINCFPHVVNISTGHVLKVLTNEDLLIDSDGNWLEGTEFPGAPPTWQTYEEAVKCDPIALAHTIVRVIWALGQHHDAFHKVINDGNTRGWFRVNSQHVNAPLKELLHDVATCWDSVYDMLHHLRELQLVSNATTSFLFYLHKLLSRQLTTFSLCPRTLRYPNTS